VLKSERGASFRLDGFLQHSGFVGVCDEGCQTREADPSPRKRRGVRDDTVLEQQVSHPREKCGVRDDTVLEQQVSHPREECRVRDDTALEQQVSHPAKSAGFAMTPRRKSRFLTPREVRGS